MILELNNKEILKYLSDYESYIANLHSQGKIPYPVHLDGSKNGNLERKLIKLFQKENITPNTYIFATHRSHLLWLLSGRDPDKLTEQILEGNSMAVFGYRFFTSSIVGGVLPIAIGVAQALKMKGSKEKVFVFCGDMAASGGLFNECLQYAKGYDLPIMYIILDNNFSVRAITSNTWGNLKGKNKSIRIKYRRKYGHAGSKLQEDNVSAMF